MNTAISRTINTGFERSASVRASAGAFRLETCASVLKFTFGLVPIVAGVDKFTNLLVHWETYLNPAFTRILPIGTHLLMSIVGLVEIAAGIIVLARPRIGAVIVTAWLAAIAISLLASGHYLDVAVRDLVMAIGAYALACLSRSVDGARGEKR